MDPSLATLRGRRVLLTGHTGFKGGWLALWLRHLGADVVGIALPPPPGPSLHAAIGGDGLLDSRIADIGDAAAFDAALGDFDAEIVIHMAAQAIVRRSYAAPLETLQTNVVGTAVVLEAARRMPSLRAIVVVTSDKCYENNEWDWGYRESDPMGGADPYSASKGCTELIAAAYRRSYFSGPGTARLATARAGNVFGGGDWAVDRLVPDLARAAASGVPVSIRNPASIRPWQHVLEPLHGYLMLAAALLRDGDRHAGAWNFGPDPDGVVDVGTLAGLVRDHWGPGGPAMQLGDVAAGSLHEAQLLRLDTTKARTRLGWQPRLDLAASVRLTVDWYRAHAAGADMRDFSQRQLDAFAGGAPAHVTEPMGDLRQCA
ncbi:CDP-glucose 4,6-dehydratase [Sandarakinorhabdus sp. DWP1-3-1]|uniref:CDP-glucose 4,6-dehydratase n=1 Tax=Sandarakinorhabdus sp. DWP1-3-1 TaxID=2804627 RepID=UPI003CFA2659